MIAGVTVLSASLHFTTTVAVLIRIGSYSQPSGSGSGSTSSMVKVYVPTPLTLTALNLPVLFPAPLFAVTLIVISGTIGVGSFSVPIKLEFVMRSSLSSAVVAGVIPVNHNLKLNSYSAVERVSINFATCSGISTKRLLVTETLSSFVTFEVFGIFSTKALLFSASISASVPTSSSASGTTVIPLSRSYPAEVAISSTTYSFHQLRPETVILPSLPVTSTSSAPFPSAL